MYRIDGMVQLGQNTHRNRQTVQLNSSRSNRRDKWVQHGFKILYLRYCSQVEEDEVL